MLNIEPLVTIKDSVGGQAVVYYSDDLNHKIEYFDDKNHKFFTEEFQGMPIEFVEEHAMKWAKGKRTLDIR